MRSIFQAIEAWEKEKACSLNLDWTDKRLGLVRQSALDRFLPDFDRAMFSDPAQAVEIYAQAYGRALAHMRAGVNDNPGGGGKNA